MMDEQAPQRTMLGRYAGFVTRLVAFVIDRAIVSLIVAATVLALQYVVNAFHINQLLGFMVISPQVWVVITIGFSLLVATTYNMGFWLLAGQTPGKRVMGVRILRTDGTRINFGNALRRQIGYIISAILFLGYIWILFDNRRQGFHDRLAGTIVVYSLLA